MDFEECLKKGGSIRTANVSKNRYRRTCVLNGTTYMGDIQTRK